jgi:hypothetical protein
MKNSLLFGRVLSVRRARVWLAAALLASVWAGCATGEYTYVTTTSYGDKLRIPLIKGAPERAAKDGIRIEVATLLPSRDATKKGVFYAFSLVDESGVVPKSVKIEDVSDDRPIVVHEDLQPTVQAGNRWVNSPRMLQAGDPAIGWTQYVGEAFRVFRFTITRPDGREIVLHQGLTVPAWMKLSMRKTLGLE